MNGGSETIPTVSVSPGTAFGYAQDAVGDAADPGAVDGALDDVGALLATAGVVAAALGVLAVLPAHPANKMLAPATTEASVLAVRLPGDNDRIEAPPLMVPNSTY
jgi:hypothetical protein